MSFTSNLEGFIQVYPEFKPFQDIDDSNQIFENLKIKIQCVYPIFKNLNNDCNILPFFMLIAHYLVMEGRVVSLGMNPPSGIVNSSSVGSVSVSFESKPYSNSFEYFLSQTPYGLEFLAWWNSKTGVRYVNN